MNSPSDAVAEAGREDDAPDFEVLTFSYFPIVLVPIITTEPVPIGCVFTMTWIGFRNPSCWMLRMYSSFVYMGQTASGSQLPLTAVAVGPWFPQ